MGGCAVNVSGWEKSVRSWRSCLRHGAVPTRPPERCGTPGCRGAAQQDGRCPRCLASRVFLQQAGNPAAVYTGRQWRVRRLEYLAAHPFCTLCSAAATVADHYPISRRVLLAMGVADPDTDDRLRPMCALCHNRSTAQRQPGGWNVER